MLLQTVFFRYEGLAVFSCSYIWETVSRVGLPALHSPVELGVTVGLMIRSSDELVMSSFLGALV